MVSSRNVAEIDGVEARTELGAERERFRGGPIPDALGERRPSGRWRLGRAGGEADGVAVL